MSWLRANRLRLVFYSLCFGLCLYQNIKILNLYFSYSTVNSIAYGNYTQVSLPALTICIDKKDLLKVKYHKSWFHSNGSDIRQSEDFYAIINNSSVGQQFEMFFSAEELFDNRCQVVKTLAYEELNQTFVSCQSLSPIYRSMDYYKICFTFLSQSKEQSDRNFTALNMALFMDYTVEVIHLDLPSEVNISEVLIFLHSRKEKIKNFYKHKTIKLNRSGLFTYIQYSRTVTKLMPLPYETKCHDYRARGHFSRYDCIAECRVRNLQLDKGFWGHTPGNFLNYDNRSQLKLFETFKELHRRPALDRSVGVLCMKECGTDPECESEHFNTEVMVTDYKWPHFSVLIFGPAMPDLIYSQSPKLYFEEFVSYIGSLLGFWFGFSAIMLFNGCNIFIEQFRKMSNIYFMDSIIGPKYPKNSLFQLKFSR